MMPGAPLTVITDRDRIVRWPVTGQMTLPLIPMPPGSAGVLKLIAGGVRAVTSSIFRRRRAERLAQLLDEAAGSPRRHSRSTHDAELADYIQLSNRLVGTAALLPSPSTQFRTSLRAQLVARAGRDGIGGSIDIDDPSPEYGGRRAHRGAPLISRGRAKSAILAGLAVGTLALSGMSAASGGAMPGSPLYSVKRSTEDARLTLASSDLSRGQLYLDLAGNRLAEAQSTGARGTKLTGLLDEMDAEIRAGARLLTETAVDQHDRAGLDVLDAFVHKHRTTLVSLGNTARVRQSLTLFDQIAARSANLRPKLSCGTGTTKLDELGAVAPACTGSKTGPARWHSIGR